jgi:HAD superfamily hydrolase (TIGR01484 family)
VRSFEHFAVESAVDIDGVLFDIDDTVTTNGALTAAAYAALGRLQAAGLYVVPVTGRPAGWCDHIARMWPVDAVVGENGAFYFRYDHRLKKMQQRFVLDQATRAANRQKMALVSQLIINTVPGCALASDQAYREADIAIDFCEDVPRLPEVDILRIKEIMTASGLTAKVSSIHVNGWLGAYDKRSTSQLLFREVFDIDIKIDQSRFIFIGDSPNDQPMFAFFSNSVGVANVGDFLDQLSTPPKYVTTARSGAGFVEFVDKLLELRKIGAPP